MLKVLLVHPDGMQKPMCFRFFYRTQIPTGLDFTCRRHGRSVKRHEELKTAFRRNAPLYPEMKSNKRKFTDRNLNRLLPILFFMNQISSQCPSAREEF